MRATDHLLIDLDGTLAHFDRWRGPEHIGEPVPAMLERVKAWRAQGIEVRIFTSRISEPWESSRLRDTAAAYRVIHEWTMAHCGEPLPITCQKTYRAHAIYDDRAYRVERNTGRIIGEDA